MKIFILLLSLTVALADHHDHHEHHEHHEHGDHTDTYVVKTHDNLISYRHLCGEQVHATKEDDAKFAKWEFVDEEKSRCYLKCVFEQFGFFDGEHGFDVHKIHQQLAGAGAHVDHEDETHQKIAACADKNEQGSDACTWAYRGGMCFMRSNLQLVQHSVKA